MYLVNFNNSVLIVHTEMDLRDSLDADSPLNEWTDTTDECGNSTYQWKHQAANFVLRIEVTDSKH